MQWQRPDWPAVSSAIDAYVAAAYPMGTPPITVRNRINTVRTAAEGGIDALYGCPAFERDEQDPPTRYAVRLGNASYPHMKLVIERAPDGVGHLFRADTHDRHIRPAPESREYIAYCELMRTNQKVAEQIEAAWSQAGLATFKEYLRKDLERRVRESSGK